MSNSPASTLISLPLSLPLLANAIRKLIPSSLYPFLDSLVYSSSSLDGHFCFPVTLLDVSASVFSSISLCCEHKKLFSGIRYFWRPTAFTAHERPDHVSSVCLERIFKVENGEANASLRFLSFPVQSTLDSANSSQPVEYLKVPPAAKTIRTRSRHELRPSSTSSNTTLSFPFEPLERHGSHGI
jgi:hypothetical protein